MQFFFGCGYQGFNEISISPLPAVAAFVKDINSFNSEWTLCQSRFVFMQHGGLKWQISTDPSHVPSNLQSGLFLLFDNPFKPLVFILCTCGDHEHKMSWESILSRHRTERWIQVSGSAVLYYSSFGRVSLSVCIVERGGVLSSVTTP